MPLTAHERLSRGKRGNTPRLVIRMPKDERRAKALREIRIARGAIIAVAARWQASGVVDTSPLVEPLARIQEALATLEAASVRRPKSAKRTKVSRGVGGGRITRRGDVEPGRSAGVAEGSGAGAEPAPSVDEEHRRLYAELRREFSGLRVSAAAMEGERDPDRLLNWLAMVESSADRCLSLLDLLDLSEALPVTPTSAG